MNCQKNDIFDERSTETDVELREKRVDIGPELREKRVEIRPPDGVGPYTNDIWPKRWRRDQHGLSNV